METGYNRETVDKLVQRFVDYGKILYDADTRELFVLNWLRYNPVTNTNVEKCVLRELKGVKNKEFVHMFLQKCAEEELNVPMLLAHFGMPGELAVDDVEPICEETEEEEVVEEETGSRVFSFMSNISVVCLLCGGGTECVDGRFVRGACAEGSSNCV